MTDQARSRLGWDASVCALGPSLALLSCETANSLVGDLKHLRDQAWSFYGNDPYNQGDVKSHYLY